ncbi:hypothetical protein GCM10008018_68980 [Paenibacillus marchantiophytorum]|uniref:Uncharacterized protein n=1 Tax=Paenibacillus marchantiophytorum TaxID=1619310 RepID=A0ABQ1FHM7_9BACL|nr:hypothetical protein GCM10008018_68980 [Paenibacillus marchantiophytorum]
MYPTIEDLPNSFFNISFFEHIEELGHFFNLLVDTDHLQYVKDDLKKGKLKFVHGLDQLL